MTAAFGLGRSTDSAPSAIFVADGELLFGEAAERRGLAQPERLVREFKRRIGDHIPIVVGSQRFAPEELYARMVAWVVEAVTEREGSPPAAVSVATPVTWGEYRSGLAAAALARQISVPVELITEPEAAARHYETTSPLEFGQAIAVYDLGGGTFDAVLLRKDIDGEVRLVGEPLGIADLGGADFDDQMLRHVIAAAGLSVSDLSGDPAARVALASLRRECVEAKEALSFDSDAVVPVLVGQAQTTVRVTRAEFEGMIEPGVERTVDLLDSALDAAGMQPSDLEAILLTGGSSRIPRIAQLLSERFDRPIAVDADPKAIVALGAARALADGRDAAPAADEIHTAALVAAGAAVLLAETTAAPAPRATIVPAKRGWLARLPMGVAVAGCALVLAGGIVFAGAATLGSGVRTEADTPTEPSMAWLGFSLAGSPAETADSAQAAPPAAAPEAPHVSAPSIKAPRPDAERPKATSPTRTEAAARPSRIPSPDAPRPDTQTTPGGSTADPAPSNPPSDPTPSDPPSDPTPSDPPVPDPDPTPSDPPAPDPDPTPSDPPAPDPDPTPTDPPVDPTPTDPPVDPTPTDPPVDPTPTDPPAPDPEPTTPAPDPEPEPEPEPTPIPPAEPEPIP